MASFQARQRDPLLDQGTQAMLERRGRELLGLVLLLIAAAFVALLGSYSPEDPGWMVATDEPAQNLLGRFGAAVSSTLMILIGLGAWSIPLIFAAWGVRFMAHKGGERALGRVVFAVIAVAFAAVHCATLVPGDGWSHTFGLGGLFGDTVLGSLIGVMPGSAGFGLKLLSLLTFAGLIAFLLFVTGFDMGELRAIWRFLMLGSVMGYSTLASGLGSGARGAVRGAAALQDRARSARPPAATDAPLRRSQPPVTGSMAPEPLRASPGRAMPQSLRPEPRHPSPEPEAPPVKEKLGLIARLRRAAPAAEPELVVPDAPSWDASMPSEERIKARISDVIRSRVQRMPDFPVAPPPLPPAARVEPPVMRPRSPVAPPPEPLAPAPRMAAPVTAPTWEAAPPQAPTDENIFAADLGWDEPDDNLLEDPLDEPAPRSMGVTPDRTGIAAVVISTIVQVAGSYLVWDFLSGMAVIALLGTGSMFLTFLVSLLAAVLAAVLGGIAGFVTFKYIATGKAGEHVNKAKGFFGGLFGRKTEIASA